jgi:hypothetical protein
MPEHQERLTTNDLATSSHRQETTDEREGGTYYGGTVTEVREQECPPGEQQPGIQRCGEVTVRVEEGPDAGSEVTTRLPGGPGAPRVSPGDKVDLHVGFDPADPSVARYDIADHQRGFPLLVMVALFAVAIVAFGRWRGLASLAGLAACFGLLITFVLPAIIGGSPPLLVAVVGAATVMFVIMYLVHGVSVRTSVAVLGTLAAVLITGLLGVVGASAVHLTGFLGSSDDLGHQRDFGFGQLEAFAKTLIGHLAAGHVQQATVLVASAYPVAPIHVLEVSMRKEDGGSSTLANAEVRRRQLVDLGRTHDVVDSASFLLAYPQSAHDVRKPFVPRLIRVDESVG